MYSILSCTGGTSSTVDTIKSVFTDEFSTFLQRILRCPISLIPQIFVVFEFAVGNKEAIVSPMKRRWIQGQVH